MKTNQPPQCMMKWHPAALGLCSLLLLALSEWPGRAVELIPGNAVWRYQNSGADLGTTWRAGTYDHSTWPAGPALLGFGDPGVSTTLGTPANGVITYYFRHKFTYLGLPPISCLEFRLTRDDGADALRYLLATKAREVRVRKLRGLQGSKGGWCQK